MNVSNIHYTDLNLEEKKAFVLGSLWRIFPRLDSSDIRCVQSGQNFLPDHLASCSILIELLKMKSKKRLSNVNFFFAKFYKTCPCFFNVS